MSTKRAILTHGHGLPNGGRPSGWYPDPHDAAGLRYWNGRSWTEHRARLAVPTTGAAICHCGVAATGSCRSCNRPYCRAHISDEDREDRAFLAHWEAWTCHGCVEGAQRLMRTAQLGRCEEVALQLALHVRMGTIRTATGHKPRLVNLFQRGEDRSSRAARFATAYLIQYDGGDEDATYTGLAISPDGHTVYDVGVPTIGVRKDRIGPKRTVAGYLITEEITLDRLRLAADRPTKETWFEFAARVFLRAGERIGIRPGLPAIEVRQALAEIEVPVVGHSTALGELSPARVEAGGLEIASA